jgi:hypothetical protein
MGSRMTPVPDRRRHVHNPFEEFGLLYARQPIISALEFVARKMIAVL